MALPGASPNPPPMLLPARLLRGVGPRRAEALLRLGVETVGDLLYYFPRDWQDRFALKDFTRAFPGGQVVARGIVTRSGEIRAGPRMAIFKAELAVPGPAQVSATWFKHLSRRYDVFAPLKKDLVRGAEAYVVGRADASLVGVHDIQAEEHYAADDPQRLLNVERIVPVYALTEGLTQRWLRALMAEALDRAAQAAPDVLPEGLALRRGLLRAPQALRGMHFPGSGPELAAARERFAYEELLLLELAWSLKRREAKRLTKGFGYEVRRTLLTPFRQGLGFELTAAQKRVINEIFDDMKSPSPMTRLLQGDVGSGKTVVALSALLLAVENGRQGAFMAPSAILAEQHKATLDKFLSGLPVRTGILTSRTTAKQREKILAAAAAGELDILVGTHALLEEDVRFKDLGLIVIDEEHRFGVKDKDKIRSFRKNADCLSLSATPIPRTLNQAMSGLRDISRIESAPEGRQPILTRVGPWSEAVIVEAVSEELERGGQVYYVHNRVRSIQEAAARISRLVPHAKVAVVHGQMSGADIEKTMWEFFHKKSDVLVASAIIESGLDIPSANTLLVENAQEFGLAQLYQLRGRVGRESRKACCYLFYPEGYENFSELSEEARKRLEALKEFAGLGTGFRLAMRDLEIRGAGDLLGRRQHGFMNSVGVDLYSQMLADEIARMKGKPESKPSEEVRIDVKIRALIPSDYLPQDMARLEWYKRLLEAKESDLNGLRRKLEDLCGPAPEPVANLFELSRMRIRAGKLGVRSVSQKDGVMEVFFRKNAPIGQDSLDRWQSAYGGRLSFLPSEEGDGVAAPIDGPPLPWLEAFLGHAA